MVQFRRFGYVSKPSLIPSIFVLMMNPSYVHLLTFKKVMIPYRLVIMVHSVLLRFVTQDGWYQEKMILLIRFGEGCTSFLVKKSKPNSRIM